MQNTEELSVDQIEKMDFIRVKETSDFRPGQDGMVMAKPDEEGNVGLIFHYDRNNQYVPGPFTGIESWHVSELDMSSLCH